MITSIWMSESSFSDNKEMDNLSGRSVVLFFFLSSLIIRGSPTPQFIQQICSERSNYTSNGTYESNLKLLLTSLFSSAANLNSRKFLNMTAGQALDMVYGLYLCRGDVEDAVCQNCVEAAAQDIMTICPNRKEAIIWYDECMLRYSSRPIFSLAEESPRVTLSNTQGMDDADRFDRIVNETMMGLINKVASNSNMFETGETNFSESIEIYGLVQCTPDLSDGSCRMCLKNISSGILKCCQGKQGARILAPSCNFRYEVYPFYRNLTDSTDSTPTAPPSPSPDPSPGRKGISWKTIIAIVVPTQLSVVSFSALCYGCLCRKKRKKYNATAEENVVENEISTVESLQFDFATIEAATNNFSSANKIGEGGFGDVYKGTLSNGQEIAIKRLSGSSEQGAEEFKNEIALITKLEHRNLVRVLGFCLEREEKILIYEYVPNRSLDCFLNDPSQQAQLDWTKRYEIIAGIARGILYLHEDSQLRVIHRDLKASNILLDGDMNPKISDFGMARIFGDDQTRGNTSRVVGTFGYISPEYVLHGNFSAKSDVYSFGVLVLEIISGKMNTRLSESEQAEDLLSNAWRLWRDGRPLELMHPMMGASYRANEVIQCVHIGLLCVQENPDDRPTMASIVLMLSSDSATLPLPQEPVFSNQSGMLSNSPAEAPEPDQPTNKSIQFSVNETSITELYPR